MTDLARLELLTLSGDITALSPFLGESLRRGTVRGAGAAIFATQDTALINHLLRWSIEHWTADALPWPVMINTHISLALAMWSVDPTMQDFKPAHILYEITPHGGWMVYDPIFNQYEMSVIEEVGDLPGPPEHRVTMGYIDGNRCRSNAALLQFDPAQRWRMAWMLAEIIAEDVAEQMTAANP